MSGNYFEDLTRMQKCLILIQLPYYLLKWGWEELLELGRKKEKK